MAAKRMVRVAGRLVLYLMVAALGVVLGTGALHRNTFGVDDS